MVSKGHQFGGEARRGVSGGRGGGGGSYRQKREPPLPSFHFLMSVYSADAMVASGVLPGNCPMMPRRIAVLRYKKGEGTRGD